MPREITMRYKVFLVANAEKDILEIYNYVAANDSINKAEKLLNKLEETCQSLSEFPFRGHVPPELERIGVLEYREIHYKPYRVIYQVTDDAVFVHCVLDGRRHLQELLEKRLIR